MAIGVEVCLYIPRESIKIRKREDVHDKDEMSVYEGGDFENDKEEQN
jgi:hypothetical protein